MTTTFEFVRAQLVTAGRTGVSQADLFVALRQATIERRRKGTYASFHTLFFVLVRLGWVERMVKTAPATTKYGGLLDILADKTFYRLTRDGRQAPEEAWRNPYVANYPEYKDKSKYYTPTGRPRGRPRVERRRRRARAPVEQVERITTEEAAEARPEPVRERKRRLRISVSRQIESELPALRESVKGLRVSRNLVEADVLEKSIDEMADRVIDALDTASGEEGRRLDDLLGRLRDTPEDLDDIRAGIARRNEVTLQRGIETLLSKLATTVEGTAREIP